MPYCKKQVQYSTIKKNISIFLVIKGIADIHCIQILVVTCATDVYFVVVSHDQNEIPNKEKNSKNNNNMVALWLL